MVKHASQGPMLFYLNITLICLTSIIVFTRFFIRVLILKSLGLDDLLAAIAFILAVSESSLGIVLVSKGAGRSMEDLTIEQIIGFFKLLPVDILIFFLATCFVRLSILSFLHRLSKDVGFTRCIWITGFVIIGSTIGPIIFVLAQCKPIGDLFMPENPHRDCAGPASQTHLMWAHCIIGIAIDVALFALPIWVIHATMTTRTKALRVILVFLVGLFAVVTGIVRFVMVATAVYHVDTTYHIARVSTWTVIEVHVGLWCACFPALQPLVRLISHRLGISYILSSANKNMSSDEGRGGPCRDHEWLSNSSYLKQRNEFDLSGVGFDRDGDSASLRVIISGGHAEDETVELEEVEKGIRLRTDVFVSFERNMRPRSSFESRRIRETGGSAEIKEIGNTSEIWHAI